VKASASRQRATGRRLLRKTKGKEATTWRFTVSEELGGIDETKKNAMTEYASPASVLLGDDTR
jgi:hypothetical protein